jgi:hypothetical protein
MSVLTAIIPVFKPERKKEKIMQDYLTWNAYPFNVDGVDFVSFIKPNSEMAIIVSKVPEPMFTQMNQGAIRNFLGNVSVYTKSEIQTRLDKTNEGYSQAYLALA